VLGGIVSVKAATPVWTCVVQADVVWQHTAAVGYLVASTKSGLCGIDAEKGAITWTNKEFTDINEDALSEISGTPFFVIAQKKETAIIDGFTGVTVLRRSVITIPCIDAAAFLSLGRKARRTPRS
jgi:hypothetical protein